MAKSQLLYLNDLNYPPLDAKLIMTALLVFDPVTSWDRCIAEMTVSQLTGGTLGPTDPT